MSEMGAMILTVLICLAVGIFAGINFGDKMGFRAGVIHGRNLEWCESRGGQWRDGACWQKAVEIKR